MEKTQRDYFERDLLDAPRRSARIAWIIAGIAMALAGLMALAIVYMMPLKSTEVFTILVDRNTGESEKIMQVQPVGISEEQAVKEALLVGYVNDREGMFMPGIQARLDSVVRRSEGNARSSFVELWTDKTSNEIYPPTIYGRNSEVSVRVRAISFLESNVAQVRFVKTLREPRRDPVEGSFIATIEFQFDPRRERNKELLWENPLGFIVSGYVVDSETLGDLR